MHPALSEKTQALSALWFAREKAAIRQANSIVCGGNGRVDGSDLSRKDAG
jgi:hypothetical protein